MPLIELFMQYYKGKNLVYYLLGIVSYFLYIIGWYGTSSFSTTIINSTFSPRKWTSI